MDEEELEKNFVSIRRALKACSFALVLFSFFQTPRLILSLQQAGRVLDEMLGNVPKRWMFELSDFLAENFIILAGVSILILIGVLRLTIRSKGGLFLYVNVGLFIAMSLFNALLLGIAQEMLRLPLEGLISPP